MANYAISFLISAKDATASTFNRVKSGVKDMASDTTKAMQGLNAAQTAVAQTMSGNLVGAAKSAAMAFKSLWSVVLANPLLAVAAAAGAVAVSLNKLFQWQQKSAQAAREHEIAVRDLYAELDRLNKTDTLGNVGRNIDRMSKSGNMDGLVQGLSDAREAYERLNSAALIYADALDRLKVGGIGANKERAELERLEKEFKSITAQMSDMKRSAELYEKAIVEANAASAKSAAEVVAKTEAEAAAIEATRQARIEAWRVEQKASAEAIANLEAQIQKQIELNWAIAEQFAEYERQQAEREAAAAKDIADFERMTSRRNELESATSALAKAELERKFIQEDLDAMGEAGVVNTLELLKKQDELAQKEKEIKRIKDDERTTTQSEGSSRIADAEILLEIEKSIRREKAAASSKASRPDVWDEAKAKDPWDEAKAKDPWDEAKAKDPWDDLKGKWKPGAEPIGNLPNNAGGNAAGIADPWSPKLDAIKGAVDALRGDLTGGGAA